MSATTTVRCDRCGCACKDKGITVAVYKNVSYSHDDERFDFCPECSKAFGAALCIALGIKPKDDDLAVLRSEVVKRDG